MKNKLDIKNKYDQKLITWILFLTFIAGMVNVYSMIELKTTISHHTGNLSIFAKGIANGKFEFVAFIVITMYFIGSIISGFLYPEKNFYFKKRYGNSIITGGIIFILLDILSLNNLKSPFIALWMGIQNAMFIRFRGFVVRTTHMTGYLSDAGFYLGSWLRGQKRDLKIFLFYITSIIVFILGGMVGYIFSSNIQNSLSIIGLFYIFVGMFYFVLKEKLY